MGFYFEDHQSMFAQAGLQVERTLDVIVRRYRGHNPPHPPTFRAYRRTGIVRGQDYRYHADFNAEYPHAPDGAYVYAWARIWSEGESEIKFDVSCHCPTVVYRNQQCVFRSTIFEERYPDERQSLHIRLDAGWNHLVLRFKKTRGGFGGVFGTWLGKLPYYFIMPTPDRAGQEGWLFSEPTRSELPLVPGKNSTEAETGLKWRPVATWPKALQNAGQCRRIFGLVPNAWAVGWTRGLFLRPGTGGYTLTGQSHGPITVTIDDEVVFTSARGGKFSATVRVPFGQHDVMVRTKAQGREWGFTLQLRDGREPVAFASPCNIQGSGETWIYTGPFADEAAVSPAKLRDLHRLVPAEGGDTYWRLDEPDTWVRVYNDNAL